MTYRILSVDGGGVRGLLVTILLQRLLTDSERPDYLEQIDLFAGVSTGAIIAAGLAAGVPVSEGSGLYLTHSKEIFTDSFWDNLKDLGFAVGAQYDNIPLHRVLLSVFGGKTLDTLNKRVLIPTFDLDNEGKSSDGVRRWSPKFFHNFPVPDADGDQGVVDVLMRTTAVPAFFPMYQGYVDGGLVANSPSMCALAQALDEETGKQVPEDVVLLSIGTGRMPSYLPQQDADWGWKQWGVQLQVDPQLGVRLPIIDIVMEGMDGVADYQCRRILGDRYHRLQPDLPEPIGLDAVDKLDKLMEIANEVDLAETAVWLNQFFD
jgi:uncharacterized protein